MSSTSSTPDAPTGTGASDGSAAAGADSASSAERFRPGGMSEDAARRYASAIGMDEAGDGDGDGEDPGRKSDRLRRRRRMLLVGGPPAVIVVVLAAWLAFLSLMTMAANNAVIHKDYKTAVSRYAIVAKVDPWLEKWRVHYNLGTAQLLDDRLDQAQASLETALETAPKADLINITREDGTADQIRDPRAPECLVRTNLYAVHMTAWRNAVSTGNTAEAQARRAAMTEAAGECEVVPPPEEPEPTPSPSPPPSPSPSPEPSPSPTASSDPSSGPSPTPTASSDPSSGPTPTPSPSSGSSSSPTPGSSSSPVPSSSPSPSDPKRDKLRERNEDANPTRGPGGGGGRPW